LEPREISATMDRVLKWPVEQDSPAHEIRRNSENFFTGFSDNDVLFGNTRLMNGWLVDHATVTCRNWPDYYFAQPCDGGAYVWEIKQGTDWPYLNVRWWLNAAPIFDWSHVRYRFAVRIIGPQGVPDGVVVP
jgi:hypothetical protein